MAAEAKRGCGYRKVGGMYLVGTGIARNCDRLPFQLPEVCPCCGAGIKQARGWTWINGESLLGGNHYLNADQVPPKPPLLCPEDTCCICRPGEYLGERCGLLWVGKAHYTPGEFIREALDMGVSKRISQVPKGLVTGKTWVLLAHPDAVPPEGKVKFGQDPATLKAKPGVFYAFLPQAVEKIVTESEAEDEEAMDKLRKRGISPVVVPDEDPDHR